MLQTLGKRIQAKHLCIAIGVLLVLSLMPLLVVAQYSFPLQDDFAFSINTRQALQNGSLWQALVEAGKTSAEFYTTWQGSYAACFLFALQPGIVATGFYGATAWLMLAALLGGTTALVYTLLTRCVQCDRYTALTVAFLTCFISVQQVPNANQAFYWYNGAVYYVFFHGLLCLLLAAALAYLYSQNRRRRALLVAAATLLSFVVAGGNYVTGLVGLLLLGGLAAAGLFSKQTHGRWLVLPLTVYAVGFAANMLAPGNAVRQGGQLERLGLVGSAVEAFKSVLVYGREWAYLFLLLGFLFSLPLLWHATRRAKAGFRLPGLVSGVSVALLAAAFFPHIYALSYAGPDRLVNIIFLLFLLLLELNALYWLGWLRKRLEKSGRGTTGRVSQFCRQYAVPALAAFALAAAVLVVLPLGHNKPLTSVVAVRSLASGEAAAYGAEMRARYTLAEQSPGQALVVPPVEAAPGLLAYGTLYEDPTMWDNEVFAAYFGLQSVSERA